MTGTFAGVDTPHAQRVTFTNPKTGQPLTDTAGALLLRLDRNTPRDGLGPLVQVFCIELFVIVGRPGSIDTYISDGPINNTTSQIPVNGADYIRYILLNYPATTITTPAEGAARQLAIWHYTDGLNLNTITDAAIRARALALQNEAQAFIDLNGPLPINSIPPTVTITPANATVPQGQPVAYTVTVAPANAAANVTISVDGSAVLDNGLQQATLPLTGGTATFNVRNPSAATSNISAAVPYSFDAGTVFSSTKIGVNKTQRLVLANPLSASSSASVQTTWQTVAPTNTPTNTPAGGGGPTNTPTNTPAGGGGPTNTPTNTPAGGGGPTNTPTNTPTGGGGPTNTPGGPTNTPGGPTNTPGGPTDTPTETVVPTPPNAPDITPTNTHTPSKSKTATPETPGAPTATPEGTPVSPDGTPTSPDSTPGSGVDMTPGAGGDTTPGADNGGAPGAGGTGLTDVKGQGQDSTTRPASLPRTGDSDSGLGQSILVIAALLLVGGTLLRRRGARR